MKFFFFFSHPSFFPSLRAQIMTSKNVVPEGPLRGFYVKVVMEAGGRQVDLDAVDVTQLNDLEFDFSPWYRPKLFPPDFLSKHTKRKLVYPIRMVIRPQRPVTLRSSGKILAESARLMVQMRRNHTSRTHDLVMPKFTLPFAKAISPMLDQAMAEISRRDRYIGAVASTDGESLFMSWETPRGSEPLFGKSLLIENESGTSWRLVQTSVNQSNPVWVLDTVTLYLTSDDISGPPPDADLKLDALGVFGDTYPMGCTVDCTVNVGDDPFDPERFVRVVNNNWRQMPLAYGSTESTAGGNPWIMRVTGTITTTKTCAPSTEQIKLWVTQDEVLSNDKFDQFPLDMPILLATKQGVKWWFSKSDNDKLVFLYVLIPLLPTRS